MYLDDLSYHRPASLQEATALLARYGDEGRPLAGGTDLIVQLRTAARKYRHLVDLKGIPELKTWGYRDSLFCIGATVPLTILDQSEEVQRVFPALWQAIHGLADMQIRNRASLAGNLCNASPAADTATPLLVYGARVRCVGVGGERIVPLEDFFVGPGRTVLEAGEIVAEIQIPAPATRFGNSPSARVGSAFEKLTRTYNDIALVNAAARVEVDSRGQIQSARVALGAVAARPLRAVAAEEYLVGRSPSPEVIEEAARLAREAASPIDDVRASAAYRRHMAGVLAARALEAALKAAGV